MAPPAPKPRPESAPRPTPPPRRFGHAGEDDSAETPNERFGHGSGCIPVLTFRLSLLAVLVWLALILGGLVLARLGPHASHGPPTRSARPPTPKAPPVGDGRGASAAFRRPGDGG